MLISRRSTNILLFIGIVAIVATVLRLGFTHTPIDPKSLYNKLGHHDDGPDYWNWETTTRFSSIKTNRTSSDSDGGYSQVEDSDLCDAFPSYLLSRVQVVLKIGASESQERLDVQTSTVTRCISNLIIFSDRESELNGHRVHNILAALPESFRANTPDFEAYDALQRNDGTPFEGEQGWRLDRFKFLPMVERAYEMNPSAEWFVFLESDTYYVWDNLFRLLDQFDPSTPLYFGSPSPGRSISDDKRSWFAYGGAGFVLSASAVEKLVARKAGPYGEYVEPPLSQQLEDVVKPDCCGDSVLGWALYQKGVTLSGMWPMFNPHPLHGIPFETAYWCQPVISMHKTALSDMHGLAEWEAQRDRTVCASAVAAPGLY